ncbi:MAG: RNA methyltransferase [Bacteroidia bacterium]|nr:RNA methyltransferase [Bacteroidia bacterium]
MPQKITLDALNRLSTEAFIEAGKNPIVVILDDVRSMNNVGSVFRSGDAFLIEKLYLCGITPTPPHREIRKTALGAEESVAWEYCEDILELVQGLKQEGYTIASVEQTDSGVFLNEFTPAFNQKIAIVLGNEVDGVSQAVVDASDIILEIPQQGTKHSLNISVAAGIVIYDIWAKLQAQK